MENKIKRTSSDSTQPKIKLALEEKYKEENQKEIDQEISNLLNPNEQKNETKRANILKFDATKN